MKITVTSALYGCSWWRTIQPCQMIERLGLAEVKYFTHDTNTEQGEELLNWGDLLIFQSAMGIQMVATIERLKQMGKAVIGDYDDLSFALSPFNPSYKTLGINEVKVMHDGKEVAWVAKVQADYR